MKATPAKISDPIKDNSQDVLPDIFGLEENRHTSNKEPPNAPIKKKLSMQGAISCIFAVFPLIAINLFFVRGFNPSVLVGVVLSPIIGFVVGIAGLFQKTKSSALPAIGVMANFVWICLLVAVLMTSSLSGMPF